MTVKKEKKQKPLEQVLMESCNKLRSNMSGINYMYFVMGLVFLKFASLKFEKRREEILNSEIPLPWIFLLSMRRKTSSTFLSRPDGVSSKITRKARKSP